MIITLTRNYTATIDDTDADLALYNWSAITVSNNPTNVYAMCRVSEFMAAMMPDLIAGKNIYMHRLILSRLLNVGYYDVPKRLYTDHIDGNGCNNTRDNLRPATPAQNSANKHYREVA